MPQTPGPDPDISVLVFNFIRVYKSTLSITRQALLWSHSIKES